MKLNRLILSTLLLFTANTYAGECFNANTIIDKYPTPYAAADDLKAMLIKSFADFGYQVTNENIDGIDYFIIGQYGAALGVPVHACAAHNNSGDLVVQVFFPPKRPREIAYTMPVNGAKKLADETTTDQTSKTVSKPEGQADVTKTTDSKANTPSPVSTSPNSDVIQDGAWLEDRLCTKIQACMKQAMTEQMGMEEFPAAYYSMIEAQVEGMCQTMNQRYQLGTDATSQQILQCQQAIFDLSCDELMEAETIPACDSIE
jgi:hypothetical protein